MRDGNNKLMPLAWAMCETESGATYAWFAVWCKKAGLEVVLSVGVIFSDRQKGIEKFMEAFAAWVGSCFRHIVENCKGHIAGHGRNFNLGLAWQLQEARTYTDFRAKLLMIEAQSARAAAYFDDSVVHEHTYLYAMLENGIATFEQKSTNNTVEGLNGTFVFARDQVPYRMNYLLCKWIGEHFGIHLADALKAQARGKLLTTWAEMLFREQVGCAPHGVPRMCPVWNMHDVPHLSCADRDCSPVRTQRTARRGRFILRGRWTIREVIRGGFGQ